MKEYDSIRLTRSIKNGEIPSGTRDVILEVLQQPSPAFVVELFDKTGESIDWLVVKPHDVEMMPLNDTDEA